LSGAGLTVIVYAFLLPFRLGGLREQFDYTVKTVAKITEEVERQGKRIDEMNEVTRLVRQHDGQIQRIAEQIVDIRLFLARELGKTNGG